MKLFFRLLTKELPHAKNESPKILKLLFGKYLLVTNIVTSGLYMGIGDFVSQSIENRKTKGSINWTRTSQMVVVGAVNGPLHHFAYKWMDAVFPEVILKNVLKKITLDQLIMSPTCITTFFFVAGLLEGKTITEAKKEYQAKFFTVYTADWCIWPPTQFINFYFLPPQYRVAYVNTITMVYNVFLSYIKHKDHK